MLNNAVLRAPVAISLGAIAGALSRYYLGMWVTQLLGSDFPYGTMLINLSGCLVMGFFATLSLERIITIYPEIRLMIATGFLGSYTTFSTYTLDAVKLLERGRLESEVLYWAGSAFLGFLSLQLGIFLAELLPKKDFQDK